MTEMIIGSDQMLPSMLELEQPFPDLGSSLAPGDLNPNPNERSNGDSDDDNGNFSDASEREMKFDPRLVKREIEEAAENHEDPFRHFLAGDLINPVVTTEDDESSSNQKRRSNRQRKTRIVYSDDESEEEDKTWQPKRGPKSIRSSSGPKRARVPNLVAIEKRKLARKEERKTMTPEQRKAEAERKRVRRTVERERKEMEKSLKCLAGEDDDDENVGGEDETEGKYSPSERAPRKRKNRPRKKVSEMTPEELEKSRAKWREEKLRQRGSLRFKASSDAESGTGNDEISGSGSEAKKRSGGRKPISEVTVTEEGHTRDEVRKKRVRQGSSKVSGSENEEDEDDDVKNDPDCRPGKRRSSGRRKKISEMGDLERELMKARWREESRLKRQRQRERWTEDERKEYLAKQNERKRQLRQAQKETITPEQRDEMNRKTRDSRRAKPKFPLTEEQKREASQKRLLRKLEREAMMTEEEKEEKKQRETLRRLEREAKMTPEEIEEKKKKKLEYVRNRLSQMSEEDKQRRRERMKQYRDNMTPEQKSRFLARLREAHYRRMARLRQDPEKFAELKEKWQAEKQKRLEYLREWKRRLRNGDISREEMIRREGGIRQRRGRKPSDPGQMSEEQLMRRAEKRKEACLKARIKRRLKIQQMLDSGLSIEDISRQTETPEQRQRRLMRNRIDSAKIRMRKKLEAVGAPPQVIEEKLNEVAETYQPKHAMRPYKPRENRRKPVNEAELAFLESLERKPEKKPDLSQSCSMDSHGTPASQQSQPSPYAEPTPCTSSSTSVIAHGSATTIPSVSRVPQRDVTIEFQFGNNMVPYQQFPYHPQPYSHSSQMAQIVPGHTQQSSQSQSYSLQHMMNTMSYQHDSTVTSIPKAENYGRQQTSHGYSSSAASYGAASPDYSPPGSPTNQPDDDVQSVDIDTHFPNNVDMKAFKRRKPYATRQPRAYTNLPDWYKTGVARGPKKKVGDTVKRDAVCDECGNAYRKNYITEHKRQMHNPNFKDGRCMPCGLVFRKAKAWWSHYSHDHLGLPRKPGKGEGKRAMRQRMKERGGQVRKKLVKDQKDIDPVKQPYMCPECGAAFTHPSILESHEYHMHGDGSRVENYFECVPCQKKFKRKHTYINHMKDKHEGYKDLVPCERCDVVFKNIKELRVHMEDSHKDSYFPCKFCKSVKLSEVAWRFHTNRCAKVTHEMQLEIRKQWAENGEPEPVDRTPIQCEFCPRKVLLFSMRRHYRDMHGLIEERRFQCNNCRNSFRSREYWTAHLESVHRIPLEECLEMARKYNCIDREGLVIQNLGGKVGGSKPKIKKTRKPRAKKEEMSDSDEESEPEVKKRRRRKKQDNGDNKKKVPKRRRASKKQDSIKSEGTETETEVKEEAREAESLGESVNSQTRRRGRGRPRKTKVDDEFQFSANPEGIVPSERNFPEPRSARNSARRAQKVMRSYDQSDRDNSDDDENFESQNQNESDMKVDTCDRAVTSNMDRMKLNLNKLLEDDEEEEEGEAPIKAEILSESENEQSESEGFNLTSPHLGF